MTPFLLLKSGIGNSADLNKFNIISLDNLNYKNDLKKIRLIGSQQEKKLFKIEFKNKIDIKNTITEYLDLSIFEYVAVSFMRHWNCTK